MRGQLIKLAVLTTACIALVGCGGGRGGPRGGMGMGGPGGGPMMGAGPQTQPRELQLRRFDANADGNITTAEFAAVLKVDFTGADKDGNGTLSTAETRALNDRLLTEREISPIIDWNADGSVEMDEFAAQWRTLFARADADSDGTVTAEELAARAGPTGRPKGMPGGGRPPGQGRPGGGRPGGQ